MLPKDLIRRIRKLEIRTRKVVSNMLAGQYHSAFKGRGMAFAEVRPYQPGDEIRTIDWNVTARMNDPYVKIFTEERELTVLLLVDVSASKEFGANTRSKSEMAAEVAAQIAFSAIANNDRVGLIFFSDHIEKIIPPKKGRKHVLRLISEVLAFKPKGKGTDLSEGLMSLTHLVKRRAVTFLISDFLATGYEKPLRLAARRHDLIPVIVSDGLEENFPSLGLVEMEDPESGHRWLIDTSDPRVQSHFSYATRQVREERRKLFRKLEVDHIELRTSDDYGMALTRFFQARNRRFAR